MLYDFQALYFTELLGLKLDEILCTLAFFRKLIILQQVLSGLCRYKDLIL